MQQLPLIRHALVFLTIYVLGTLGMNWSSLADNTNYNFPTYIDLMGYRMAAQKAELHLNPFGFQDTAYLAVEDARVWKKLGMKPGTGVGGYIYPPLVLHVAGLLPLDTPTANQWFTWVSLAFFATLGMLLFLPGAGLPLQVTTGLVLLMGLGRPFYSALSFGQVNVVLVVLMLWAYYFWQQKSAVARGTAYVLIALCFWVKIFPAVFMGVLALRKPERILPLGVTVLGVGLGVYALGPVVFGQWVDYMLFGQQQIGALSSKWLYSSFGLRLLTEGLITDPAMRPLAATLVSGGVLLMVGFCLWWVWKKRFPGWAYLWGLPIAVGLFLLAPVSWDHHLVYYSAPALLGLWALIRTYGEHRLLYGLTALVAYWMTAPRYIFNTHNIWELAAYRIDTLLALAVLGYLVLLLAGVQRPSTNPRLSSDL